jgi:predicted O-methyltransferase YrrM
MPDMVDPRIERYAADLVPSRDPVLAAVEKDAQAHHVPMIGPYEGQALATIARIARASTILEIGTATGYSAIWLARVAKENGGSFLGIELDRRRHAEAIRNLAAAGLEDVARVINGDAVTVLAGLNDRYDFVFLDLVRAIDDPALLQDLLDRCVARLAVGGVLAIDNVLHGGEVINPPNASARAADALNRRIAGDPRLSATFLTIRDGVAIAVKTRD